MQENSIEHNLSTLRNAGGYRTLRDVKDHGFRKNDDG